MERLLSTIIGSGVVSRTGEHLGTVAEVVLDPRDGSVEVFRVKEGFIFAKKYLLLPRDVRVWNDDTIEISGREVYVQEEDIPLLAQKLRSAFPWVGLPVETESGMKLGRVDEIAIHMQFLQARRMEVRRAFLGLIPAGTSIIAMERVSTVTRRAIIVLDDPGGKSPAFVGFQTGMRTATPGPSTGDPA